ncbi:hypothetical protein BJ508DRAFT_88063 [Ascobolus immersus RN42]|uniref:Uncharacterized protein n=1 Tax=Ascobolus immersus RN42 TaxID=1160509 RepID=A0A3N4HAY4_ASCIM|nr:hypothetical protein BJ508DRAFT_88063 [Ascobolus immersus RN42]
MYTSAYRSSCLGKQLRISSAVSLIELLQVQLTSYDVNGNLTVGSLDQSRSFRNSDALMNSCGSLVRLRTPEPYTMRRYQSSKEMKILEPAHYTVVEYLRSEYLREHSNSLVSWLSFSDKESRKVMWETFFGFILSTSANLRTGQDAARIFQRHFRLFKLFLEDEQGAHWWTSLALFCVEDAQLFELFEDIIFNHTSTLLFFLSYLHRGSERELHNDLSSRRWVYSAYEFRHVLRSFDQTISKMTAATCVPSQSIPTSHETESDAQLRINASSPTAVSKMLLFFLGMDDELLLKLLGSGPNVLWEIISPSNSATRINVGAVLLNEACRRTFVDLEVALKLIELGADYREPCFPVFQPGIGCFESFMHSGCEERSNYGGVEDMMFSVHRWVSQANPESTENTPSKLEEVIERIDSQSEDIGCVVPFSCTAVGIETALHSIARGDSYKAAEVLQHLLNIGADVNSMLPDGSTPLHFASLAARFQNYETLLGAGAEVRCNHLEQLPVFRPFGVVHRNLGGSDGIISIPSYALSCGSEGATSHPDRNNFARSTKSNRRDGGGRIIDFHRRFLIPNDSRRDISYRTVEVDDGYGQRMHMDREDDRLHYYTSKSQEEGWPCTVIPFRRVSRVEIRSRHTHMLRWGNISYGTALENASSLGIEDYEMVVESLLELGRAACACRGKRDLRSVSAHIANRTDPDSENGTSIETETRRLVFDFRHLYCCR